MADTTEAQAKRRMAKRRCGNCREPATTMLAWEKQTIAICGRCAQLLQTVRPNVGAASQYDEFGALIICHFSPDGRETSCGLDADAGYSSWTDDRALVKGCSTCQGGGGGGGD